MYLNSKIKKFNQCNLSAELCVVGGGIAGICTAVAAARNGSKVLLIQDRPVLGGNASSEIRMWISGAHGRGNKETGIIEEILLENYYYNPTLNYTIWDDLLRGICIAEPNIELLLNCTINDVSTSNSHIKSIQGWSLTTQQVYNIEAKLFADCSGDSILRVSGAEYRSGREAKADFNESHAPDKADSCTMGNSILIQLREILPENHIEFKAPSWSYHYTDETVPKRPLTPIKASNFWWLEIGGTSDTIEQAEEISFELLQIAYGVWEYIKNHPDGRGHSWELDWIGSLPGKRENIRYEGDYIMTQNDIETGGKFDDIIGHGGWSMDDHNPMGIEYEGAPTIFHPAPSPFGIPFRALYSKNIDNLLFAGRNISATHMAMSATRVMGTTAIMGQAIGTAAAIAINNNLTPREVYQHKLTDLQDTLMDQDQYLPWQKRKIPELTLMAKASHDLLRSGIERNVDENENGVWLAVGEFAEYHFEQPMMLRRIRLIFDSDLERKKQMCCLTPLAGNKVALPQMLTKAFEIQVLSDDKWHTIYEEKENFHRLVIPKINQVKTVAVRLKINETWGGMAVQAHLFSFEVA